METRTNNLATLAALAQRYRLPTKWLRVEAESGRIPCLRVGRRFLFNVAAVEEALLLRARDRSPSPVNDGAADSERRPIATPAAATPPMRGDRTAICDSNLDDHEIGGRRDEK